MMRRKIPYRWLLAALLLAAVSCIRDELKPCPALTVRLAVKDKNYFNADATELERRLDENLPFGAYVPTLCYSLREMLSGEVVEQRPLYEVTGPDQEVGFSFCPCLPHGTYILTVWGGSGDEEYLGEGRRTAALHTDGLPGDDIYLAHDTLVYDAGHTSYRLEMERTKGRLLIEAANLPDSYDGMACRVDNLWSQVTEHFEYSIPAGVSSVMSWQPTASGGIAGMMLAPSAGEALLGWEDPHTAAAQRAAGPQIGVEIRRNELTLLRYNFDPDGGYEIYLKVDAGWEKIYSLDIE